MIKIGRFNHLNIARISGDDLFLDGGSDGEIWLPKFKAPKGFTIQDKIKVFLYYDSDNLLAATTSTPLGQVGEVAYLKVLSLESVGAFLDWGLPKDLFLPFREQVGTPGVGQSVCVFIYLDSSGRISASMKVDKFVEEVSTSYQQGDAVNLFILGKTDLGYKAVINNRCVGILYFNEVFQPLKIGEKYPGYIQRVRDDGKVDLSLGALGYKASESIEKKILLLLAEKEGFLPVNDKTEAELIYKIFGVSKKKFKMAVGRLLKQGLIFFEGDGIRLKSTSS